MLKRNEMGHWPVVFLNALHVVAINVIVVVIVVVVVLKQVVVVFAVISLVTVILSYAIS